MNNWMKVSVAIVAVALGSHAARIDAQDSSPAVVIEWNAALQQTSPVALGPLQLRLYAVMHIAMFDAANSIARDYKPFHTNVGGATGGSMAAATAQAAHDVLSALIPASKPAYDALLNTRLAGIPPGLVSVGVVVGRTAAARTLDWRANDGALGPPSPYVLPVLPGLWQPAAAGVPPGLTQLPRTAPFTLLSQTQFLPWRFPEIDTARYAMDFNEVKSIGAVNSATRSPEQTQVALLWATQTITVTNIFVIWNNVARDAVLSQDLNLLEAARVFALMNASMFDGLITTQTGKFIYGLWRPITAIRNADSDPNPDTAADATWTPLLATPPYPSYPGNMACLGASAARSLELLFGRDDVALSATWRGATGYPDVTRSYSGFSQLALEEANSRIYGGIHYRFDNDASRLACPKVAEWAYSHVMQPRN
jgi:hypothetical protein